MLRIFDMISKHAQANATLGFHVSPKVLDAMILKSSHISTLMAADSTDKVDILIDTLINIQEAQISHTITFVESISEMLSS